MAVCLAVTVAPDGSVTAQFDESLQSGANGIQGFTTDISGMTFVAAIDGTDDTIVNLTPTPAMTASDAGNVTFTSITDGLQDQAATPNDVDTFTIALTNNMVAAPTGGSALIRGLRRVINLSPADPEDMTAWNTTGGTPTILSGINDPDGGTNAFRITATSASQGLRHNLAITDAGRKIKGSWYVRRNSGSGEVRLRFGGGFNAITLASRLTTSWQRFSTDADPITVAGTNVAGIDIEVSGDSIEVYHPLYEDYDGLDSSIPSEYVADVGYFSTVRANTVTDFFIVNDVVGAAIAPTVGQVLFADDDFTDSDGITPVGDNANRTHEWRMDGTPVGTNRMYVVKTADIGAVPTVFRGYIDDLDNSHGAESAALPAVVANPNTVDRSASVLPALLQYGKDPEWTYSDIADLSQYALILINRFRDTSRPNALDINLLREQSPDTIILAYILGARTKTDEDAFNLDSLASISRYNGARGATEGDISNGNNSWLLKNAATNEIVPDAAFPTERLLDFGSSTLTDYYIKYALNDSFDQSVIDLPVDGAFIDTLHPATPSQMANADIAPTSYSTIAAYDAAMNGHAQAVSEAFQARGLTLAANRGESRYDHGTDAWTALDGLSAKPEICMEEGAFAVAWGGGDVQFWPADQWQRQIDLPAAVSSDVLFLSHTDLVPLGTGTDLGSNAVTYEQILRYCAGSYLLAKQTGSKKTYFTWTDDRANQSYNRLTDPSIYDAFDYGAPVAAYVEHGSGLFYREYDDGSTTTFVYVNPTAADIDNVALIGGGTVSVPAHDMQTNAAEAQAINTDPVLAAVGNQTINEGDSVSFTLSATDADPGDTLTYSSTALPTGSTLDANTGAVTLVGAATAIDNNNLSQDFSITFTVSDDASPAGTDDETITFTVTNAVPVLNAIGNQAATEGTELAFTVSATDPDGVGPCTYAISGAPAGHTLNTVSGEFDWTPGANAADSSPYTVTITAIDPANSSVTTSETFDIVVSEVGTPHTGGLTLSGGTGLNSVITIANDIADVDGVNGLVIYHQRDGVDIPGSTGTSYTVKAADSATEFKAVARYTEDDSTPREVESAALNIPLINFPPTGTVTVTMRP